MKKQRGVKHGSCRTSYVSEDTSSLPIVNRVSERQPFGDSVGESGLDRKVGVDLNGRPEVERGITYAGADIGVDVHVVATLRDPGRVRGTPAVPELLDVNVWSRTTWLFGPSTVTFTCVSRRNGVCSVLDSFTAVVWDPRTEGATVVPMLGCYPTRAVSRPIHGGRVSVMVPRPVHHRQPPGQTQR